MRKVIGIGETVYDIVFKGGQPTAAVPGGSTFNSMISIGRCGIHTDFLSEIGSDKVGEIIREFMENHASLLNDKEYKTCILIRAGFKPKSISNMLNVGPSYISNIRTEMLKTLFGIVGSSKVFDEILKGVN